MVGYDIFSTILCCIGLVVIFVVIIGIIAITFSGELYQAYAWSRIIRALYKAIFSGNKESNKPNSKNKKVTEPKSKKTVEFEDAEFREVN